MSTNITEYMFFKRSLNLVIVIQNYNTPEISEQKKEKKLFLSLPGGGSPARGSHIRAKIKKRG